MVEETLAEITFTLFTDAQRMKFPFKQFCSKCERIQTNTKEFFTGGIYFFLVYPSKE